MLPASPSFRPLRIPESSFLLVCSTATWLCPVDRDAFWLHVRDALEVQPGLGEGCCARAIAAAFEAFYRPIDIPDEPKVLAKLDRGSRRFEAKLDALEAKRTRRQRSDAR